ncbi:protein-glutamate O-methyltransferase [Roseisalinus antarcticus]|uniref:Chemotaxis protein methyltransferase n=1 Tax=Roseisalinus antarcticus TaxID=254357 RepID=A0A1Y5SUY1_9RHOB|nr:protein-glutamate O-methyltransferase [Roseisalinus antarcticus]SLN49110.1 Chemotaxis protein methyltransferase [Roseisalinus antarcticus]
MNTQAVPDVSGEFDFSDAQFKVIAQLAYENFGLDLQPAKRSLVYSRLTRRLRALRLPNFKSYLDLLTGPDGAAEQSEMLSALTTNVTHFFREKHHFDQFRDLILPEAIKSARNGGRVRFWSAGCSAGQEPYSIAMCVLEACPDAARYDIRILATDVDPVILARAKAGLYLSEERDSLPADHKDRMTIAADRPGEFTLVPEVKNLVQFGLLNLVKEWPVRGPFQAIFCRNVAIYFDKLTQARLWSRFAPLLETEGMLFIGHSERISGPAISLFNSTGITSYRRNAQKAEMTSKTEISR